MTRVNVNRGVREWVRGRWRVYPAGWIERRVAKQLLILRKLRSMNPAIGQEATEALDNWLEEFHEQISL